MSSYFVKILLIFSFTSCHLQKNVSDDKVVFENTNSKSVNEEKSLIEPELVESFIDESKIGRPKKNKIEVYNYRSRNEKITNDNQVVIKFYSFSDKEWKLKQTFEFEKDDLLGCDPQIKDFNNDGFKDITYISTVAARGANEVRKLFIYDKSKDELTYIKNSEDYPNILYNKDLNCIDSFMVHGSSSTVFVKIDGDMLKEFASVHNGLERTVYIIDKNGKEKMIQRKKMNEEDMYVRYKSFNPPKEY
jgi:hypothetical protein